MANASPTAKTVNTTHLQTSKPVPGGPGVLGDITGTLHQIQNDFNPISRGVSALEGQGGIAQTLNPLYWISKALGDPNPKDLLERGALMLFGAILVIVGLILFVQSSKTVQTIEKEGGTAAVAAAA